jgi:RNA polymerase sigma factor (sigma-70 family)
LYTVRELLATREVDSSMVRPPAAAGADDALVQACLAREPGAWEQLHERFSRLIYSVVHGTLRRHGQALEADRVEDLFGDAFLALAEHGGRRLGQWSGRCSLASWVRLVTASVVVDALRRSRPTSPWPQDEDPDGAPLSPTPGEEPEAMTLLAQADRIAAVRAALSELREPDRELLVRLFHRDESAEAVAAALAIRPGALYTRKCRALARLRELLVAALGPDAGSVL